MAAATNASFLHASDIAWQQHYGAGIWKHLIQNHTTSDDAFRTHLECTLRSVLSLRHADAEEARKLRITLVGGSFSAGNGGVGPVHRWVHLLQEWLSDALQHAGVTVQVKNAVRGAMESSIVAVCMRDQIGIGDADIFLWDLCTNDGFTQSNMTTVEDVVQEAIGRAHGHEAGTQPSIFLICSPNNGWWVGTPKWQIGDIVRRVARHYHASFLDVASAVRPYATMVNDAISSRDMSSLPPWLRAPHAEDHNHAGKSVHRLISDLVAQQLGVALRAIALPRDSQLAACHYPKYPVARAFTNIGAIGSGRPTCVSDLWCPGVDMLNRTSRWRSSVPCKPMPSAEGTAWAQLSGRHTLHCVTSQNLSHTSRSPPRPLCFSLPSRVRIGRCGAIVYSRPDGGTLIATSAFTSPPGCNGEPLGLRQESSKMVTSGVRWGHHQLLVARGLAFGGAGTVNRSICIAPHTLDSQVVHLCGVWWTVLDSHEGTSTSKVAEQARIRACSD